MAEGLQRPRWRRGCFVVLIAALVAAVFLPKPGRAQFGAAPEAATDAQNAGAGTRSLPAPARRTRHRAPPREPAEDINANTLAIISGNPNGTYLSIAHDLSAVLDDGTNFRVLPVVGKGGGQNLRDVRYLKGIDLGITQSVILNAVRDGKELGDLKESITYVAKLFNEEMHIVVRADADIKSIRDLDGKRVNFSDAGSGTQISTRTVFERLGLKPVEVNMGQNDAVEKLKSGELAATVLIAGKPAGAIAKLTAAEGFRLLPIPFAKELQADFLPATLASQDYPNMIPPDRAVDTVAVSAILVAYNWPRGSDRYRRIEKFVEHFFPRLADFQLPPRHPKWSETNLAAVVPGWKRFPAAQEWLDHHNAPAPGARSQREQFERFLTTQPQSPGEARTPQERERLFQDFLRWNESRESR